MSEIKLVNLNQIYQLCKIKFYWTMGRL